MIDETLILNITEIIGTIAFAVSGALVAIGASLDVFGVLFLGCITATGGGIIRDLFLGVIPPSIFLNFKIFIIAVITALIVFIIGYINSAKFHNLRIRMEEINIIFDAIGLSAFSVMGTEVALSQGFFNNMFLAVSTGVITGIGGGILRDMIVSDTPYVLKKHIYAIPSILGSIFYYLIRINTNKTFTATLVSMLFIIIMRMLAAKLRWKLPKIKF